MPRLPKLLPCPFCGQVPVMMPLVDDQNHVVLELIGCSVFVRDDAGDLISCEEYRMTSEGWNKRIPARG